MSVLSFPRIYFKGYMEWDPCTFNNNDWQAFQTYDAANAQLNWPFLNPLGITQENCRETLRPWAITLQQDTNPGDNPPNGAPGPRVPAEWNMFGSHSVKFVQNAGKNLASTIVGGDLGYGVPSTGDPLIGQPVMIGGDGGGGTALLVDTNPTCPWSSQVYLGELGFGNADTGISGVPVSRIHSRWLNVNRIYSGGSYLTDPAFGIGVCFQAGIPTAAVTWPSGNASALVTALQNAANQPGAQGIMVRITAYANLYFMNGVLNDFPQQPRDYPALATALQAAWQQWNASGGTDTSGFFSQPCYSHVVGVVGVWNEGELATVPVGRCLSASANVTGVPSGGGTAHEAARAIGHVLNVSAAAATDAGVPLGPVAANVDFKMGLISLDLSSTIPENATPTQWPSNLAKVDFGPLTVGLSMSDGSFQPIAAPITSAQYDQTAYEASAGVIDLPFLTDVIIPPPGAPAATGFPPGATLAIQVQQNGAPVTALAEQPGYRAQTDTRGIYVDQSGPPGVFPVTVFQAGVPAAGVNLMVVQYDGNLNLVPTNQQFVQFTTGLPVPVTVDSVTTGVAIFTTDQNGNAVDQNGNPPQVSAQAPGFPVIAFYAYSGAQQPPPTPSAGFTPWDDAFYTTVRVLPFDDAVPQTFVDFWNANPTPTAQQAYDFIYANVLCVYDMLFSVMLNYVNLGDMSAVVSNIGPIWQAIALELAQGSPGTLPSTEAMPVTRDMSAGKRLTLQLWIYLVANSYNVPNFSVSSIPSGWPGPGSTTTSEAAAPKRGQRRHHHTHHHHG